MTGGSGFLGSNLSARLAAAGARVRVLSRSDPSDRDGSPAGGIEFCRGDIRDQPVVERVLEGCDLVFNLAGLSGSAASNRQALEDLDVNARGQLTLLEACRRASPQARVVFASSRLVYKPTALLPVSESAPTGPISLYGIHKLAAEQYHLLYARLYELQAVILRLTNPYGPMQRPDRSQYGIINWFIHLAIRDAPLPVYGDGRQLRDYIHVSDVTGAFMLAGLKPEADGQVFNVGSGQAIAFREMAELVTRVAHGGSIEFRPWPVDQARVETGSFVADISRITSVLGWRPGIGLPEGIAEVVGRLRSTTEVAVPI